MRELIRTILKSSIAAILIIILSVISSLPVMASIASPDTFQIQDVQVYENGRESGDQLYLVTYYIHYDSEPDETAEELFILRLLDGTGSEITSTKPYAFYNDGYDLGVMAFYLDADDAPDYEASLTVQLTGDPLADWTSDVPVTTTDGIIWTTGESAEIREIISTRVIYLASTLEQAWTTEMITTTQGTTILSDTGAAYFLRVVPYLDTLAPYALGQYTFTPDFPDVDVTDNDYADDLEAGIDGTILDLSPIIRSLPAEARLSRGTVLGIIYYMAFFAILLALVNRVKLKKGTGLLAFAAIIGFSFFGVPLAVAIIAAFVALISISYVVLKQA
jgi:hypothetical protein